MIRKGLAVVVILLFIGVAFAPSINASVVKDELVEFKVEFHGLGKKHSVHLTQDKANEVELLFDDIEQRLSKVENRNEAEDIFKEAVVELDKYGLLGGLSVRQVNRYIERVNQDSKMKNILNNIINRDGGSYLDEADNVCCLVFTRIKDALVAGLDLSPITLTIGFLIFFLLLGVENYNPNLLEILLILYIKSTKIPLHLLTMVPMGNYNHPNLIVYSLGLKGFNATIIPPGSGYYMYGFTGITIKYNMTYEEPPILYTYEGFYLGGALLTIKATSD